MGTIRQVIKCKVLGCHTIKYAKGFGYRCACCGKTAREINKGCR